MKALAFSGGKDSMACLHLLRDELDCAIYVDTGFTYPETRAMVEYARDLIPLHTVYSNRAGQNAAWGIPSDLVPIDWTVAGQAITGEKPARIQSWMQCCWENLSWPLLAKAKALGVTHLYYGQRNQESYKTIRRNGDTVDGMLRLHPIEDWTSEQVLAFLAQHMEVPAHYSLTRSSLDCYDCPAFARVSQDLVAWTHSHYPTFYDAYKQRKDVVDATILEAVSYG